MSSSAQGVGTHHERGVTQWSCATGLVRKIFVGEPLWSDCQKRGVRDKLNGAWHGRTLAGFLPLP